MKITSNTRYGYENKIYYRYYLDGNELWFNFDDVCKYLNISSSRFIDNYFNTVPEYNKRIFEDNNGVNTLRWERARFINKAVYDEFSNFVIDRFEIMDKDMQQLEVELGLKERDNGYETKQLIGNIVNELSKTKGDINKVRDYTSKLFNTPELQNIINSRYNNVEIEERVKTYREWLISGDYENDMFISHKENNEVYTYIGPTIDEALEAIYKLIDEE
jgi:hypothetical protein